MLDTTEKSKKFAKGLWNFIKGFTLLLTYEVIEELLEEAIAWTITTVAARAISFLVVVLLTQTTKVTVKGLAKGLVILFKPLVKRYTYKEGNDKIDKLRRIYKTMKNAIVKFFAFVARNKKSLTSTIASVVAALGSGTAAGGGLMAGGVAIPQYAYYLIGAAVAIVMFVLCELGVAAKGFESQKEYDERIAKEEAEKAEKKALKEAEAKAKAEEEALLKAIEEEEAKKLEEEQAKEAKNAELLREQEERRKADELKAKAIQLQAEYELAKQNGFEGSIKDFIANKKKA